MNIYQLPIKQKSTNIIEAAKNNDINSIRRILCNNLNAINLQDNKGNSALHISSQNGNIEIIKLLVSFGVNLNLLNKEGHTALHKAQMPQNNYEVTKLLIDSGASPNKNTPIYFAINNNNLESYYYLEKFYIVEYNHTFETIIKFSQICLTNFIILQRYFELFHDSSSQIEIFNSYIDYSTLFDSNSSNSIKTMAYLISFGLNINTKRSEPILHQAIKSGNIKLVEFLLNQNADITLKDKDNYLPICYAIDLNSNIKIIELLLDKIDKTEIDNDIFSSIIFSVRYSARVSNLEIFELVTNRFKKYINIDIELVRYAAGNQLDTRIFKKLIKHKLEPFNEKRGNQYYIACSAISSNKTKAKEIIETLINEGYKFDNIEGNSWLVSVAVDNNNQSYSFVKFLTSFGIDPYYRSEYGNRSILHQAGRYKDMKTIKWLLNIGVEIDAKLVDRMRPEDGNTPLDYAIKEGNLKLVKFLIENGAKFEDRIIDDQQFNPEEISFYGENTYYRLASNRYINEKKGCKVLDYLIENKLLPIKGINEGILFGAHYRKCNFNNRFTPLHETIYKAKYFMTKWLVKHGADLNATYCSLRPLEYAFYVFNNKKHHINENEDDIDNKKKDQSLINIIKFLIKSIKNIDQYNANDTQGYETVNLALQIKNRVLRSKIISLLMKKGFIAHYTYFDYDSLVNVKTKSNNKLKNKYYNLAHQKFLKSRELLYAILYNDNHRLKEILLKEKNLGNSDNYIDLINFTYYQFQTPLLLAISLGHIESVKTLIKFGVDLNKTFDIGKTPLIKALTFNKKDILELLIKAGADLTEKDKQDHKSIIEYDYLIEELEQILIKLLNQIKVKSKISKKIEENINSILQTIELAKKKNKKLYNAKDNEQKLINCKQKNPANQDGDLFEKIAKEGNKQSQYYAFCHYINNLDNVETIERLVNLGFEINPRFTKVFTNFDIQSLKDNRNDEVFCRKLLNNPSRLITPLEMAVLSKAEKITTFLLEKGAQHTLLSTIAMEKFDQTELLIDSGHDINKQYRDGITLLHEAISKKYDIKIIESLIRYGADVNHPDQYGLTPLTKALTNNRDNVEDLIKLLINRGANIFCVDIINRSIISSIIGTRDLNIINLLIKSGYRLTLSEAIVFGFNDIAIKFIKKGRAINLCERGYNNYPIHIAAANGNVEIINKLLKAGAQLNYLNHRKQTALDVAISYGHFETIEYLKALGALTSYYIQIEGKYCESELKLSETESRKKFYKEIPDNEINKLGATGETYLTGLVKYTECNEEDLEILEILINKKIDINAKNKKGETAIFIALEDKSLKWFMKLIEKDIGIQSFDRDGNSVLHKILTNFNLNEKIYELIELIIDKGIDIHTQNKAGISSYTIALGLNDPNLNYLINTPYQRHTGGY